MRQWPPWRSNGSRVRLVCQAPSRLTSSASLTGLEVGGAGVLPGVVVDGGVADQHVQAAVAAGEVGGDLLNAGRVGHVESPGQHVVVAWQGGGGPRP